MVIVIVFVVQAVWSLSCQLILEAGELSYFRRLTFWWLLQHTAVSSQECTAVSIQTLFFHCQCLQVLDLVLSSIQDEGSLHFSERLMSVMVAHRSLSVPRISIDLDINLNLEQQIALSLSHVTSYASHGSRHLPVNCWLERLR